MADRTLVAPSTTTLQRADVRVLEHAAARHVPPTVWIGALYDSSGHADELRGFLRALEQRGHEPAVRNVRWSDRTPDLSARDMELFRRQEARHPGSCVAIHHYLPAYSQGTVFNQVNVHRAMFETDRAPATWISPMMTRDELWVPSQFNVETFAESGVPEDRLKVLGETMDFDLFVPDADPIALPVPDGSFVFLTNFDFSERKGWKQLLHAWKNAFDGADDVCLLLKTGSFYKDDAEIVARIESWMRSEFGAGAVDRMAPIRFMTDMLPTAAMPGLYAAADAYVMPSRGEGWGRPYMEALAMGLPTVASNWSGQLAFMDEQTSWLVDGELVPVAEDADLFNALYCGHKWFEADADALAEAMREIASDPAAARAKAAPARADLIRRFGPEAIAARIAELAADVHERKAEQRRQPYYTLVRGRFGSIDSLAVVNDGLVGELEARGHNVFMADSTRNAIDENTPTISQSFPPVFEPGSDGPTIAVLQWEFGAPPQEWADAAHHKLDRVWVASEYVRRGYLESGVAPGVVEVVPNGVDLERFTPEGPAYPLAATAGCTFLFVGGTTWRKGADILIEGWKRAFGPGDDVQLVVKDFQVNGAYRNQTAGAEFKRLAASGTTAPIVYIDDDLPFDQLPALYRAADVVVLPYRGEGFCLPALEAMACGVPVVHNGEGPTGEFVGDVGGWPLPADRVPLPPETKLPELAGPGYVYEVDPDVLAERLRAVAADAADRAERAARGIDQAQRYGWSAFADRAAESLATLEREGLPLARDLRRAEIESRTHVAVYAPDWNDDAAWTKALDAWIAAFGPADDVTLALYVDGDADAVGARVMAHLATHDESQLPDLALVVPSSVSLTALAASADAVLTDGPTDPAARPELLRRARRIVATAAEPVAQLAEELRS